MGRNRFLDHHELRPSVGQMLNQYLHNSVWLRMCVCTRPIIRMLSARKRGPYDKWRRNEFEKRERMSGAGKFFWSCPSTFLVLHIQLVVLVSAFVMVSTVWPVSCLLFFYSRCPPCPAICKSGGTRLMYHCIWQTNRTDKQTSGHTDKKAEYSLNTTHIILVLNYLVSQYEQRTLYGALVVTLAMLLPVVPTPYGTGDTCPHFYK